jgi:hypothetical protein
MPIKLYNKSKWPEVLTRRLLTQAGRRAGANVNGVVVKVTQGHRFWGGMVGSEAKRATYVYEWHLRGKPFKTQRSNHKRVTGRLISTNGGYIHLVMPGQLTEWELEKTDWAEHTQSRATLLFRLAVHEWAHIRDLQAATLPEFSRRPAHGRRPNWADRPEEIRAEDCTDEAMENLTPADKRVISDIAAYLRREEVM